jgi:hypothetical protein
MSLDLSGKAIEARLREASRLAGTLSPEARLSTKIDMSGRAIGARLRQASDLLELCRKLRTAGDERWPMP